MRPSSRRFKVIEPAGIEAAIRAAEESAGEQDAKRKAKELALEQARYEAGVPDDSSTRSNLRVA